MPTPADPLAWGAPAGSVEVLSRRRQGAKTFRHVGTLRRHTTVFGGVLHYEPVVGGGAWEDADTAFRPSGSAQVADHLPFGVTLSGTNLDVADRSTNVGIRYTVPAVGVTVSGNTISFTFAGLSWVYTVTRTGLKLEATAPSARGNTSFSFSYARLGGSGLVLQANGSVAGSGFVIPPPYITGADGVVYRGLTSWTVSAASLTLNLNDTSLPPAAYPYVLDPTTTFAVAAGGSDGDVNRGSSAAYPPSTAESVDTTNTLLTISRGLSGGFYAVWVVLMTWDTSSIPEGSTLTAAELDIYSEGGTSGNARSLTAEWYTVGTIDAADYTATAGTTALAGSAISGLTGAGIKTLPLDNTTGVSTSGQTGLRLHVSGAVPTTDNYLQMASFDHATHQEPRLLVTYDVPAGIYAVDGQVIATSGTSATAITGTLPAAPTEGNLLVAMVDCAGAVTPTVTSDWNKLTQIQSTDTGVMFWKKVPAADTALQTLTSAGTGSSWGVVIQEFAGVDPTTQLLVSDNQASTTTSKASPSVSPTAGKVNALIVGGAFSDGARTWSTSAFTGSNVGTVTNAGTGSRGTTTAGESATLWYAVVSSTTGSYTSTITCSAADGGGAAVAVFNPFAQDTPELRGRPFGSHGQAQMQQLLAQ